ncbi:MAG: hypothetical protein WA001_01730, partial [Patescibacteria group bacterium]
MKKIKAELPREILRASVEPSTLDAEKRTVDLLFYTGAYVRRYSWEHGPIELAFEMKASAARMDRANSGAPLLNAHSDWSLSDVIGVVEKASVTNGKGVATVRFSDREDVQPIFRDVQKGILRNVSMGVVIHQMKEVTEKGDAIKKFLAIDWELMELSMVPIGADPGAHALSEQAERFPCEVTFSAEAPANAPKGAAMKIKVRLLSDIESLGKEQCDLAIKLGIDAKAKADAIVEIEEDDFDEKLFSKDLTPAKKLTPDDRSEDRKLADIKEADTKRSGRIHELMLHFEMDELWAQRHIKLGSSVDVATADARRILAEKAPDIDGKLKFGQDYESIGWKVERMSEALAARALTARGQKAEVKEAAKRYATLSVAEVAYALLETLGMTRGRALDALRAPYEVIKLAMGTPDFPGILANVLNKTLMPAYVAAMPSYRAIAQQRNFRDYRPHKFVRLGDFPITLQVGEGGEITEGSIGESSETVTALKYGRILNLLWEVLVNDDVGAFTDFGGMVARRIADRENALFYMICILAGSGLGPDLADGVDVYNSAHANLTAGGALSNTLLEEGFGLMATQTSIDGIKINVPPRFVLTSATSHVLARRLLSPIYAAQASNVNAFVGMLEPLYDANITGTRFY